MIDRKEFAEELMLRENVRNAIRHVLNKRETKRLNEEKELRSVIRRLLEGQSAVASVTEKVVAASAMSPEGVTFEPDQLLTSDPNTCVCLTSWTV